MGGEGGGDDLDEIGFSMLSVCGTIGFSMLSVYRQYVGVFSLMVWSI